MPLPELEGKDQSLSETVAAVPAQARRKAGGVLLLSAIVAALGSFLFGFDTAVISGTTESLQQVFHLSKFLLGFTVSSALIGTMVGSLLVGRPADRWGRRPVLPALAVLVPESPRWLIKQARRAQAEAVLERFGHEQPAQEADDIVESLTAETSTGESGYGRLLVMALLAQAFAIFVTWNFNPVLIWLVVGLLIFGFGRLVWTFPRKSLKALLLACMIGAFNQLDGINAVIYYTTDIFRMAGADKAGALMQSVIVGLTNLLMTIVAMALIDRVGRKALLLVGSVTFVVSHALAAWVFQTQAHGWLVIAAMMGVVGSHAYSQGAVVWVIISELLPNAVRASGSAIVCFLVWVLCAGVSWSFPVVAAKSGSYAFRFFAAMMVLQFVLVLKYLPETKGVSLEKLQKRLGAQN